MSWLLNKSHCSSLLSTILEREPEVVGEITSDIYFNYGTAAKICQASSDNASDKIDYIQFCFETMGTIEPETEEI